LISEHKQQYLVRAWEERPVWVCAKGKDAHLQEPLPLVGHPEGCEYRNRMTRALENAEIKWRIAYTSPDVSGLQEAVISGLGVSALTRSTFIQGMQILSGTQGFPALEKIRIGLFYKHPRLPDSGLELSNLLIANLDQATDKFFTQSTHP
jgi:DNA-binding transcriptional LysR family regulator